MARTSGALSKQRSDMRKFLETTIQSFPDQVEYYLSVANPTSVWRMHGSVYQYTRFETLRGMLGGAIIDTSAQGHPVSSLWATSSFHLNDSEEFVLGKRLLNDAIGTLPNDNLSRSMRLALKNCTGMEVYCACFSAVDDDLTTRKYVNSYPKSGPRSL